MTAQSDSQNVKVGIEQGGDRAFVKSGGELDIENGGSFKLAGVAVGSTSAELDAQCDVSAYQETIIAAGALSLTKKVSKLALVGAGAVTLAAPSSATIGQIKLIEMSVDNGDVTLALTNVVGQSTGTTATFNDATDQLVLLAGDTKWIVLKERGIALA